MAQRGCSEENSCKLVSDVSTEISFSSEHPTQEAVKDLHCSIGTGIAICCRATRRYIAGPCVTVVLARRGTKINRLIPQLVLGLAGVSLLHCTVEINHNSLNYLVLKPALENEASNL